MTSKILTLLLFLACLFALPAAASRTAAPTEFLPVTEDMVLGAQLKLIARRQIAEYSFIGHSLAPASFETNGILVSPLYFWRVEDNAIFLSEKEGGEAFERFRLVASKGDVWVLQNIRGELLRFRYAKHGR